VSLHGGPKGFDIAIWEHIPNDSATLYAPTEIKALLPGAAAIFRHVSPAGDEGYPGKLTTEVLFALVPTGKGTPVDQLGSLLLVYRYKVEGTDGKPTVTPVNLTHHWGFNLDASLTKPGGLTPDVKTQLLTIKVSPAVRIQVPY
jgi:aldose 1-epimerase